MDTPTWLEGLAPWFAALMTTVTALIAQHRVHKGKLAQLQADRDQLESENELERRRLDGAERESHRQEFTALHSAQKELTEDIAKQMRAYQERAAELEIRILECEKRCLRHQRAAANSIAELDAVRTERDHLIDQLARARAHLQAIQEGHDGEDYSQ